MLEPLIVTDARGIVQSVNQVTLEILKYESEDLIGKNLFAILQPESDICISDGNNENNSFRLGKSEQKLLTKDGREIPVLLSVSTINDDSGAMQQYIFVAHDLTEKIISERIIENERKEKLIAIHDAQEEEKFRIAVDLHDGLGQILTATSYSFQNLFGELKKDDAEYQKNVNLVTNQIDNAVRETKIIARNLIPLALKDFGLLVAVNNLVEQASQRSRISFSFDSYNFTSRIDAKLEKALFRIFQEATNNIIKHSRAQTASFQINKYDDAIVISIEDDGIGFDLNKLTVEKKQKGIGLMGMRERILAFNGSFTINSKPGSGTEILIEIPCYNEH
jgi:PAS domain S-box-containing protein